MIEKNAKATAAILRQQSPLRPALAVVLGSGFQLALGQFKPAVEIPYAQLPGFPTVGISGHAGKVVFGTFGTTVAMVLKGRAHYYEGHDLARITFPIRVLAEYGIKSVLLTNAAGAINKSFKPGDLMVFEDHINFMGANPLRGQSIFGRPLFLDLSRVYDQTLNGHLRKAAKQAGLKTHDGVYMAVSGPTYETPAEVRAYARLGADAVGMSTVPEAIVARQCGMAVAAVSCITNLAAGLSSNTISHDEVLSVAAHRREALSKFLAVFSGLACGASAGK